MDEITEKVNSLPVGHHGELIESFDPKIYAYDGDMKYCPLLLPTRRKRELQKVSKLIFNMGMVGCSQPELVDAIRYSMVVIDSIKNYLNWKKAKADFHIDELMEKYGTK
jgi:hypothetical protein